MSGSIRWKRSFVVLRLPSLGASGAEVFVAISRAVETVAVGTAAPLSEVRRFLVTFFWSSRVESTECCLLITTSTSTVFAFFLLSVDLVDFFALFLVDVSDSDPDSDGFDEEEVEEEEVESESEDDEEEALSSSKTFLLAVFVGFLGSVSDSESEDDEDEDGLDLVLLAFLVSFFFFVGFSSDSDSEDDADEEETLELFALLEFLGTSGFDFLKVRN